MSEDTGQERTESPTPRRRQQARVEGKIAKSHELSVAAVLLAGGAALAVTGGRYLGRFAMEQLREGTRALSTGPMTLGNAVAALQTTALGFLLAWLPFALGLMVLVLAVNLAQARGTLAWKAIHPKWAHLSPIAGIKRLVSLDAAVNLIKSLVKLAVLGFVTYLIIARSWPELTALADTGPAVTAVVIRSLLLKLVMMTGLAFAVVALADYAFQWHRTEKSLRMTRQEVKREHKDSEGDPVIKGRILTIARARARRRMLQQVPTADVVVVNPTEIAIALKYDAAKAPAPLVVAMGERKLAERIKALALRSGVPIVENRPVARALLATATLGRMIPPALYTAIAEILAYVYRKRNGLPAPTPGRTP